MTYEDALSYIHTVSWRGKKRGLWRIRELLARLGDPQKNLKFVHVAGTNGKGSTAACIESVLRTAGYRTGLFTSPYITRFNERIRVCGRDIPDGDLCALVEAVRPPAESMEEHPTEFELITAMGMLYFCREKCDVVVLEVGLGGEFDSTNVIGAPEAAVITAIGLDHTAILGPTLTDIARAKAGIIKPGCDAVIYGGVPEADEVFREACAERGARLRVLDRGAVRTVRADLTSCVFDFGRFRSVELPLAGAYQPYNAALAITALDVLRGRGWRISDGDVLRGLASVRWPGRFELLRRRPAFILDGAHNPPAVAAAAESLRQCFGGKKIVFLTGVMADKDIGHIYPQLAPLAARFVTVAPDNPRALPAEAYAALLRGAGLPAESCPTVADGVRRAVELAGPDGVVCALGTLYFSADVRRAAAEL